MKFTFNHSLDYQVFANGIKATVLHTPTGIQFSNKDTPNIKHNMNAAYDECVKAVAEHVATKTLGELGIVEKTIAPTQVKLYACHDQPRPVAGSITHYAPDGYTAEPKPIESGPFTGYIVLTQLRKPIRHTMSTECQYDKQQSDVRCLHCKHIRK